MTTSDAELEEMLRAAYRLGNGPAKFAALDTVFRHADAAGNTRFAFRARLNALHDLHHCGEYTRAFMAFSWCLTTFDRHPEVTAPDDEHSLLWRFKWIVWELSQFPAVPLDRTVALLDDMQRRYQAGGHSLHAVYQHRGLVAVHLGDLPAAGHWFEEMVTARRDGLSDCRHCVPSSQVSYLVAAGRFEEAIDVGTPYTSGGCTEQPQWMLSELLSAYLHTGRLAEAVQARKNAYQRIRDSRHHLELIGLNLQFCGLTGNEQHALPIVERHLPWLDRPASPFAAMEFASAAALVLRRLRDGGQGDTRIRRCSDDGGRRWDSTVTETHDELVTLAQTLAAQFDARNGNGFQGQRIRVRLAAEPIVPELPLTVLKGRPIAAHPTRPAIDALIRKVADLTAAGDSAAAASTQLGVAYALRNAAQWADAIETAEEARRSLDQAGVLDEALNARYLLVQLYTRAHQRKHVRGLVDELLAAAHLPPSIPAREALLEETAHRGDGQRAVDQLLEAASIHRANGNRTAEARTMAKALPLIRSLPANWAQLVARLDELIDTGDIDDADVADVHDHLCRLQILAKQPEAALDRAQRNAACGPALEVRAAELLLRFGRYAEADQHARPYASDDDLGWRACEVVVQCLRGQGLEAEARRFSDEHDLDDDVDD